MWFVLRVFYPCGDTSLGEFIISRKGAKVWSCKECEWIHGKETVARLNGFLADAGNRGLQPATRCVLVFAGEHELHG